MNNAYIRAQQCKVKEAKFPFVKIGSQYWTTKNLSLAVTPQGNTIPEMQANGNVEKITNIADREFSSNTGFWSKTGDVTINGGVANFNSIGNIYCAAGITIGKWIKISVTISNYVSGILTYVAGSAGQVSVVGGSNGTFVLYAKQTGTDGNATIRGNTLNAKVDNVSVQEIGWSGSQELYDGIYAQTSGTVEQKTYAAVKAAAMWCNYNNDAPTGLIYGKLYNWFAVKLFQMDIDYYNAANPTKKWGGGWRIPTQSEFQTLSTYLGGGAVSGGHLKEAGTVHWNSPNTGADNSSGFTALGSGYRNNLGVFVNTLNQSFFMAIDGIQNTSYNSTTFNQAALLNTFGFSIRLIKA